MICKNCGGEIRPSDALCPRCGTLPEWEGGNGFWDMAGEIRPAPVMNTEKKAERSAVPPAAPPAAKESRPTGAAENKGGLPQLPQLRQFPQLLLALLLLLLVLCVKNASLKKENATLEAENATLIEENARLIEENETPVEDSETPEEENRAQNPVYAPKKSGR